MGFSVFPAPSSGITVADGNNAGWRRTNPGGLTLVTSGNWSGSINSFTISGLSGYSFYRLFIIGYYNSVPLDLRFNSNSEPRYDWGGILGTSTIELQRRSDRFRINSSNGGEYNATVLDIYDADSANYKFVNYYQISRGQPSQPFTGIWSKAEAVSSLTIFTNNGANFFNAGYDGQGYYLYGGY